MCLLINHFLGAGQSNVAICRSTYCRVCAWMWIFWPCVIIHFYNNVYLCAFMCTCVTGICDCMLCAACVRACTHYKKSLQFLASTDLPVLLNGG